MTNLFTLMWLPAPLPAGASVVLRAHLHRSRLDDGIGAEQATRLFV